jgi:hypothetical protein
MRNRAISAVWLLLFLAGPFTATAASDETGSIRKQLMSTWSSADAPLTVEPIVVAGDHAVADWTAVSPERLARMASFKGVVRMDQHSAAGHID